MQRATCHTIMGTISAPKYLLFGENATQATHLSLVRTIWP